MLFTEKVVEGCPFLKCLYVYHNALANLQKAEAKLQAKLAKMTPEQLQRREERLARKAERDEAHWQKERLAGEAFYDKMQIELAEVK